jgi:trimeric autotransporter adhesin
MKRLLKIMAVVLLLAFFTSSAFANPVISNVGMGSLYGTSAVITWTTNVPSTSRVTYGTSKPPATQANDSAMVTEHRVLLTGLLTCTTYYFSVMSNDGVGPTTDNNGGNYYSFKTGSNTQTTYSSTNVPRTIPKNGAVSSTITVSNTEIFEDIDVTVAGITFDETFDLSLYLISPDSTVIPLSLQNGETLEADYQGTIFDDEAAKYISDYLEHPTYTGRYKPAGQLGHLYGTASNGVWTLEVVNDYGYFTGTIDNWSITFSYPYKYCEPHAVIDDYTITDDCTGTGNGDNNGVIDPGEDIVLAITLHNNGNANLTSVSGTLSTSTTGVTVTDSAASFPSIAMGANGTSISNHFKFNVVISKTCGSVLTFNLHVVSTQKPAGWDETLTLVVGDTGTTGGTIIDEDFTFGIPVTWTIVNGGTGGSGPPDASTWKGLMPCPDPGTQIDPPLNEPFAIVDSYCAGVDATQDEELITPVMDLSIADTVTLQFDQGFFYWGGNLDEVGDVDVKSSLTSGTWVNVLRDNGTNCFYNCVNSPSIDISDYAAGASNVQVRFHYYDAGYEFYWIIDNVKVIYTVSSTCSMDRCCPLMTAPSITNIADANLCSQSGITITFTAGSPATRQDLFKDSILAQSNVTSPISYNPGNKSSHVYKIRTVNGYEDCYIESSTYSFTDEDRTPAAPAAPTVTDIAPCATTGVSISWGTVAQATSYDLYVDGTTTYPNVTSPYTYTPGNNNSHNYQIRGKNVDCTGSWSTAAAGTDGNYMPGTPSVPVVADINACQTNGVTITWSTVTNANTYDLYVDSTTIVTGVTSPYTYSPGNTSSHNYQIRGVHTSPSCTGSWSTAAAGTDANSTPGTPSAPAVADINACSMDGVTITWSTVTLATSYDLYIDATTIITGVTSPYTHNPGNTSSHNYQIRGKNVTCTGAWSAINAGTDVNGMPATPAPPAVADVSVCVQSGVTITWSTVTNANTYDLYVDSTTIVAGVTSPYTYSPVDTSSHNYQIRGVHTSPSCTGSWSTATPGTDVNENVAAPTISSVADKDICASDGVIITWGSVSGATGYDLYVDAATVVPDVTSPATYIPSDANNHNYQVRAKNASCTSGWSVVTSYSNPGGMGNRTATITVTTDIIVGTPSQLVDGSFSSTNYFSGAAVAGKYIMFDFGAGAANVINEAKYYQGSVATQGTWEWQGSNNGSTWVNIGSNFTLGGALTQTITTLSVNSSTYRYYRLLGVSGVSSSGPYAREFEFKIGSVGGGVAGTDANGMPGTPTISGVTDVNACATSGVTVTWGAVSGATGYDLRYNGTTIVTTVTSPYVYSPGDNSAHNYEVRAKNSSCTGSWSTPVSGTDANGTPSQPSITLITDNNPNALTGITISYTAGSPATRHDLYKDSSLAQASFASGSTYSPGDSVVHNYVIRAVNGTCYTNSSSVQGQDEQCTIPSAPVISSVTDVSVCAQSGVTVTFTTGAPATQHDLYVGGSLAQANITSPQLYTPGDTASHAYVVRAVNASCTTDSNTVNATDVNSSVGAPTISSVTDVNACLTNGVTVTWGAVSGATGYDLRYNGATIVTTVTSPYVYSPGDNDAHNYEVRAKNASCTGNWSAPVPGTDVNSMPATPGAPVVADISACEASGVTITWGAASGATGYDLFIDATTVIAGVASPYSYSPADNNSHNYQIRSKNTLCTSSWSTAAAGTDVNDSVGMPTVSSVADKDSCASDGVIITWGSVSGATGYDLYVDAATTVPDVTSPYTHIPGDANSHSYQVRAKNPSCTGAWSIATSYSNPGGTGNRTAAITVTSDIVLGTPLSALVDGSTSTNINYFSGVAVAGKYIMFDFGAGAAKLISEAKFYQGSTVTHGIWVWQGSNNGSTWSNIGANFTLGGFTTQTITTLSVNSSTYRYYRLLGISGAANGGPYIREFEFKINSSESGVAASDVNNSPGAPTITGITDVNPCAQSGIQVAYTAGSPAGSSYKLLKDSVIVVANYISNATYNPGDTSSHTYIVQAVGTCTTNSPGSAFADANNTPSAPTISNITDVDACATSGVTVIWGTVSGATGYDLRYNGATIVADVTSPYVYAPGDNSAHNYEVRAKNASCTGAWSAPISGTDANNSVGSPTISSVVDKDGCASDGVIITWGSVSGATGYDLNVDSATVVPNVTSPSTYIPGDANSHNYQVRAKNASCTGAWSIATSYSNPGGTGNRTAAITVTSDIVLGTPLSALVDGSTSTNINYFSGAAVAGKYIMFDFGASSAKVINEVKYYQSNTYSHGTWEWQGSNNGSTWDNIGTNFTLGGVLTQTITSLSGNTSPYRYYRLLGISGTSSASPYAREFEFKINSSENGVPGTDVNIGVGIPGISGVADVDACAQSGVTITWGAVSGATGYDLYIDSTTTVTGVTSPYPRNPGDTNSHNYQVRAKNASCTSSWSTIVAGTDANGTPTAVTLSVVDPDGAATCGVTVTWTGGTGAAQFNLYVDTVLTQSNITSGYVYPPGNVASHNYVVRAVNGTCYSDSNLVAVADPGCGGCTAPVAEVTGDTMTTSLFSWTTIGSANYRVMKGTKAQLTNLTTGTADGCLKYSGPATSVAIGGNGTADDPQADAGRFFWYLVQGYNGSDPTTATCMGPAGGTRNVTYDGVTTCP